jgi:DNA-binding NarL/FixJ family response regulator
MKSPTRSSAAITGQLRCEQLVNILKTENFGMPHKNTVQSMNKMTSYTTFDEDKFIIGGLQAGAKGYLLKAVSLDQLTNGIRTGWKAEQRVRFRPRFSYEQQLDVSSASVRLNALWISGASARTSAILCAPTCCS